MESNRWLPVTIVFSRIAFASPAAYAQQPATVAAETKPLTDPERDSFIQMAMRSVGLPGLQTVVVKNGRIVWAKSYGSAVLDQPGPRRAMSNDSVLISASVAKILVIVAALDVLVRIATDTRVIGRPAREGPVRQQRARR